MKRLVNFFKKQQSEELSDKDLNDISDEMESYTEYFDDDSNIVKETGYKIDGVKNGSYISYESSGIVSEVGTYKDGKKHGTVRYFSPIYQSSPMDIITYKDGIKSGPYQEYYFGSNVVFEEGTYKNGKKSGSYIQYDEFGKVDESGTYKEVEDGKSHDTKGYTLYYKNGNIREKGMSQTEGPFTTYYENGRIKEKGHYKNRGLKMSDPKSSFIQPDEFGDIRPGVRHGESKIYSEDGELKE